MAGRVDRSAHFLSAEKILILSPAEKTIVRDHVEAIIQGQELRGSRRCQDLLHFIVIEALNGNFQNLRERVIGEKVFGRSSSYDTGADAVVRVSANELRKRLAQCYLTNGGIAKVQIGIPAGSYIPEFRFKEQEASPLSLEPPKLPIAEPVRKPSWQPAVITGLSAMLILSLVAVAGLSWKLLQYQPEPSAARVLPWTAILDGTSRTFVVLGDTGAAAAQDLLHASLNLDDYIRHNYIPPYINVDARTTALAHYLTNKRLTSLADVEIAVRIDQINPYPRRRPILRFAREMQVDDFKNSNAIIIDSKRTNPWVELFQSRLNFHLVYDEKLERHVVQNQSPKKGERSLYLPAGTTGTPGEAYAVLALLPNLSASGYVLIIEGTNMEGTEAAGELAADAPRLSQVLKKIGLPSDSVPKPFELFLRVNATGGTSSHADLLAFRLPGA